MESKDKIYEKLISDGWRWDMDGFSPARVMPVDELTQRDAEQAFRLTPDPEKLEDNNGYILKALEEKQLRYFSCYLHFYEPQLNAIIWRRLHSGGSFQYDPERFLDMKLACREAMLAKLADYDPTLKASFSTYVYRFVFDAILAQLYLESGFSFKYFNTYKVLRRVLAIYNNSLSEEDAIAEVSKAFGVSAKNAAKRIQKALELFAREPFYITRQDEDSEETGEDVTSFTPDYVEILQGGVRASKLRKLFYELDDMEQEIIDRRLSVSMTDGRTGRRHGASFEQLAQLFELSDAGSAERSYKKALNKLAEGLIKSGEVHGAKLRRKSQTGRKNITAAVYEYQADCDGEWGEIQFDFVSGTATVVKLADWDTVKSNVFAEQVKKHILSIPLSTLPKEDIIVFE